MFKEYLHFEWGTSGRLTPLPVWHLSMVLEHQWGWSINFQIPAPTPNTPLLSLVGVGPASGEWVCTTSLWGVEDLDFDIFFCYKTVGNLPFKGERFLFLTSSHSVLTHKRRKSNYALENCMMSIPVAFCQLSSFKSRLKWLIVRRWVIPVAVSQRKDKILAIAPPGWEHHMPFRSFVSKEKKILMEHWLGFVFTWKNKDFGGNKVGRGKKIYPACVTLLGPPLP